MLVVGPSWTRALVFTSSRFWAERCSVAELGLDYLVSSNRRVIRLGLCAAVALSVLSAPALARADSASAEEAEEARRLYEQGIDLYSHGSYEEAIASWERSYKIKPWSKLKKFMADSHEKIGKSANLRQAAALLREYVPSAPQDEREAIDNRITKLEQRAAEREKAEKAKSQVVVIKPETKAPEPSPPVLGIVLTGLGVVTTGTGVALGLLASGRRPDAAEVCRDASGRQLCQASAKDAIDASSGLALAADVTWITGALVAGAGVVLIVTHGPKREPPPGKRTARFRIAPALGAGAGGALVSGVF